ncbi:MAG: YihY family inner membrane protein [Pseudomonadota bacterium]|nr:YihY family inner membrane protein [Pseudomonadota bacterium]
MLGKLLGFLAFLRYIVRRWTDDRCPQIAGSLAFTTLLALVPIFAIAVSLLSRAPFFEEVMVQIKIFLLMNLMPDIAGRIITVYMAEFSANAARLTVLGVAILFVTAVALMLTIDRSINAIWRTRRSRPVWISIIAYVALLSVGPILIGASVSITTYLLSMPARWANVPAPAHSFLLQAIPTAVSTVAFFLIYRLVPHRRVPWVHALTGGLIAAVMFEIAKEALGFYVAHVPTYSVVYGAFAAVPFFLLWVYVSWLIVLFGAEVAAALGEWPAKNLAAEAAQGPSAAKEDDDVPAPALRKAKRGKARSARSSR